MFQAIIEHFSTSPISSPGRNSNHMNGHSSGVTTPVSGLSPSASQHVNMTPRGRQTSSRKLVVPERDTDSNNSNIVSKLVDDINSKNSIIASLTEKLNRLEKETGGRGFYPPEPPVTPTNSSKHKSPMNKLTPSYTLAMKQAASITKRQHPLSALSHIIHETGRATDKIGTRGSLLTSNILDTMQEVRKTKGQQIAEKFLQIFQSPVDHIQYLQSPNFAHDLMTVCNEVSAVLEKEPRCLFMQSPVYVFGDIHGNLEDLHFFSDNLWRLGMDLTAGQFLFLGDYVDRGMSCLECVAYLFGLKLLYPNKISLLRGNHETRDVNGWEEHYHDKSFIYQCKDRFGYELGVQIWEECNLTFDRLPLSAIIDHDIFCIHGGIPRPIDNYTTEIQAILAVPAVSAVMPAYDYEKDWQQQVATDCIWSDPASESQEKSLGADGFGESPRGGGAVMFGSSAVDNFLETNKLSYIIRAHEAHAHGVALSKGARVFTVFSTSKDHRQGSRAMAGCILVDVNQIQVINRSHKYKNKYVHRRTSLSVENLTNDELEERRKLGLVRFSGSKDDFALQPGSGGKLDHYFPTLRPVTDNQHDSNKENSSKVNNDIRYESYIPTFTIA